MTRRGLLGLTGWMAAVPLLLARDDDHGGGKHGRKHNKHDHDDDRDYDRGKRGAKYFRQGDVVYLREYYGPPGDLPPGLRKKYYRTGKLPPGWEKRFRPFPPVVVQRLPPVPAYCERGYVDGYAVVYDRRTRIIVDILDIVAAASGR